MNTVYRWLGWGLALVTLVSLPSSVAAQSADGCAASPENVTVVFPADLNAALGASADPLAPGDAVTFVTEEGVCVGRGTWTDSGVHISVAGAIRPDDPGYQPGDSLRMRIRDASAQIEYAVDRMEFKACPPGIPCSSEGRYVTDGLLVVSRLTAATPHLSASVPFMVTDPYPNPSARCGQFNVAVAEDQRVRIAVYNALGQQVRTLHRGMLPAERMRTFRVCRNRLASGAYFIHVTGESFETTRRITFVR